MKRCLLSLIGGVLLLASLFVNIPAATVACENLSPEEQTRLVKQLDFRAVEDKTLLNDGMVTFDVSEKHEIAIGLLNDVILILDKNFQIFRMYQFNPCGSYYIYWEGENLCLYFIRGDYLYTISQQGHISNVQKVAQESNDDLNKELQSRTSLERDGITYKATKTKNVLSNFFAGYSYDTLTLRKTDGDEIIVFHADKNSNSRVAWVFLIVFGIIMVCALSFFLFIPKQIRKRKTYKP